MMLSKLQAPEVKGEEALSMGTKRDSLRDKEKNKAEWGGYHMEDLTSGKQQHSTIT